MTQKTFLPYYVYTWAYHDGVVFYVGMGSGDRVNSMKGRNWRVREAVKRTKQMGHDVQRTIIATFKVRQHAQVYERMLIETYGMSNLANEKSEQGEHAEKLAKPLEISTIEMPTFSHKKTIDHLTYLRVTKQLWEDDGAAI